MLKLTKIGYTLTNGTSRRANIVGVSDEDAIHFLRKLTKNGISTIDDVGMDSEIHAYTDNALAYINKKTPNLKKERDRAEPLDTNQKVYLCPWCDKEFEKPAALKSHITKTHKKE